MAIGTLLGLWHCPGSLTETCSKAVWTGTTHFADQEDVLRPTNACWTYSDLYLGLRPTIMANHGLRPTLDIV